MTKNIWDRFWESRLEEEIYPPVSDIAGELRKTLKLNKKRVIEVGAGTGRTGIELSKETHEVWLLDFSKKSLILAKKYLKKNTNVCLVKGDALNTPFADETFDIVYHQGLLEHFKNPYQLIKENKRILKKNGYLLIDVPQKFHIYTLLKHFLMLFKLWFAGWEREFTKKSLEKILKKYGFSPVKWYASFAHPGIGYRIIREVLKKLGIRLPLFPGILKNNPIQRFFDKLRYKNSGLYLGLSIGVIAKKL